jgi:hypothetical protein
MLPAVLPAPDYLLALLDCPADVGSPSVRMAQEEQWKRITAPHSLFVALENCVDVSHRSDPDTQDWVRDSLHLAAAAIARWRPFASYTGEQERLRRWESASALIHAALSAVLMPSPPMAAGGKRDEKKRRDAELALRKGDWSSVTGNWQEIARLSFTAPTVTPRSLRIPFAYVDGEVGDVGYLEFDLMAAETPRLAHHPKHAFCSTATATFEHSLRLAWNLSGGNWNGRWRLVKGGARPDEECIPSAMGESAGGAAAYALGCLADGRECDSGVIVLTRIDENLRLDAVDEIAAKVQAIVTKAPTIHTIVVVDENHQAAVTELARLGITFDVRTQNGKRYRPKPDTLCCIRLDRGLKQSRTWFASPWRARR